jgi:hypothetical protein
MSASNPPPLAGLQLKSLLPADYIPTAVAAGDVNGDGIPDWVVANGGSNNLWVYLGRGDGTFTQATVIPLAGQSPTAVALVDLRAIGKLDIVVAEADSESIGVLLGNGDGTFAPEKPFFVPGAPISLAVADLNGDGHPDIVAGLIPDPNMPTSGAIASLLGDGTGNFGAPLFEPYLNFGVQLPQSIAVADFEKNGRPDAVVADPGVGAVMYVNDGNGFLKEAQPIDITQSLAGVSPEVVVAGDVNEDGCPDVVDFDSLGIATVFLGNCDSTFQPPSFYVGEGDLAWAAALVDVNGDGHLDLVYSGVWANTGYGQVAGNLLAVHFGDGKGHFGPAQVYRGGQTSYGLAVADFNRDGHPDVITANQDSDSATIFLNDGKGGFGVPTGEYTGYINGSTPNGPVNAPYSSFFPIDVNGDGKPDLVYLLVGPGSPNPFQAAVMLNDGTGHFGPAIYSPVAEGTFNVTDFLLGDFRNTGRPDLVTISSFFGEGTGTQLVFAPNAGGGSFGPATVTELAGTLPAAILAAGDFNGDGNLDLAIASGDTITIYLGHGDGTFTPTYETYFLNASRPTTAFDVTGDGRADLIESDVYTSSFQVIPAGIGVPIQLQLVADPVIGSSGSVQVSLATVSSTSTQVTLAASDPAISVPASVTIPAGSLTQDVNFTIGSTFNSSHVFWIQGTLNGVTSTAYGRQATAQGQYGVVLSTYWNKQATFPGLPTADYQLSMSSLAGYATTISLSCQGLPAGTSCQFGSNTLTVGRGGSASTSVIVNTTSNAALGVYPFTIVGTDGTITSTVSETLDVGDYSVAIAPTSQTVLQTLTANYSVTITSIDNYGANFSYSCTGIPSPGVCTVGNGFATIQTNNLATGTYNFTVGVSNGVATRTASAQLNVGGFNATLSGNTLSVAVGQSGNITISVTGQNGFTDAVTLTCSGAPAGTTCGINPASVTPSSGGTPATMTVTVNTKPALKHSQEQRSKPVVPASIVAISGLLGLLVTLARSPRNRGRLFAGLILLAVISLALSCGGGGTSGGGGGGGGGSTSFTLTVQASADGVTKNVGTVTVTVP